MTEKAKVHFRNYSKSVVQLAWRRGLLRLWIVCSVIWMLSFSFVALPSFQKEVKINYDRLFNQYNARVEELTPSRPRELLPPNTIPDNDLIPIADVNKMKTQAFLITFLIFICILTLPPIVVAAFGISSFYAIRWVYFGFRN
ncbi:MAG: hypothetical protein H9535_18590 [Ignavibacteria bacterium]|nr:hypothetical protein [Ignavibacteria bacterium]